MLFVLPSIFHAGLLLLRPLSFCLRHCRFSFRFDAAIRDAPDAVALAAHYYFTDSSYFSILIFFDAAFLLFLYLLTDIYHANTELISHFFRHFFQLISDTPVDIISFHMVCFTFTPFILLPDLQLTYLAFSLVTLPPSFLSLHFSRHVFFFFLMASPYYFSRLFQSFEDCCILLCHLYFIDILHAGYAMMPLFIIFTAFVCHRHASSSLTPSRLRRRCFQVFISIFSLHLYFATSLFIIVMR